MAQAYLKGCSIALAYDPAMTFLHRAEARE